MALYKCSWGYDREFDDLPGLERHESQCDYNPASRACETCAHAGATTGGNGANIPMPDTPAPWVSGNVKRTCAVGMIPRPGTDDNHARACPRWSPGIR